jgi:hypothetical protein
MFEGDSKRPLLLRDGFSLVFPKAQNPTGAIPSLTVGVQPEMPGLIYVGGTC